MRAAVVSILLVLVMLGLAAYLYFGGYLFAQQQVEETAPQFAATYEIPGDYHLLEGQGGIPETKVRHFGVQTEAYAYLGAWQPIQASKGVGGNDVAELPGDRIYEMNYEFRSENTAEEQYLEFSLNGEWDEAHFGFGFDKTHASDPSGKWQLIFRVQVDGREVYASDKLTPTSRALFMKIDIKDANHITFISQRVGYQNPFHPVLLQPFVVKLPEGGENTK